MDARGWIGCSRNIHSIVYIVKVVIDIRRTTEKENLDSKAYELGFGSIKIKNVVNYCYVLQLVFSFFGIRG